MALQLTYNCKCTKIPCRDKKKRCLMKNKDYKRLHAWQIEILRFLWKLKNEIFALSHVRIRILFVLQNRNSRKPHLVCTMGIFCVVKKLYLLFRSCWVRAAWVWAAVTWLRRTISSMKRRYTSLLNRYKEYFEERGCGLVGVKCYTFPPPPHHLGLRVMIWIWDILMA